MKQLITSESVTEWHPDKICDQISDAVLDECLRQDPESRVAAETATKNGAVWVFGEITTKWFVDIDKIVRETLKTIWYDEWNKWIDYKNCGIFSSIIPQSENIKQWVDENNWLHTEQGAGDQWMMFWYACDETKEYMPLPISLAHKLSQKLAEFRKNGTIPYLGPDGKSQVTIEYENNKPIKIDTIVISNQHKEWIEHSKIVEDIKKHVINPICHKLMDEQTNIYINPTWSFIIGWPQWDAWLTWRKIIVDTYWGVGKHGGGAFSWKDPSKVDRSGAYIARYIAKNIVASWFAKTCEVQLAYAIWVAKPVSIWVNTFDTGIISDDKIADIIEKVFPIKPADIIKKLGLKSPIYSKTASYWHFGRDCFPWEKLDKVDELKKLI